MAGRISLQNHGCVYAGASAAAASSSSCMAHTDQGLAKTMRHRHEQPKRCLATGCSQYPNLALLVCDTYHLVIIFNLLVLQVPTGTGLPASQKENYFCADSTAPCSPQALLVMGPCPVELLRLQNSLAASTLQQEPGHVDLPQSGASVLLYWLQWPACKSDRSHSLLRSVPDLIQSVNALPQIFEQSL